MPKVLFVGQDKGGVGKSTLVRAVAEVIQDIPILEIDNSHRLIEFDRGRPKKEPRQVTYFPMRADREAIDSSGGEAARAEFDEVLKAIETARVPTVVDVGANTATALFSVLRELAPDMKEAGIMLGIMIIVTSDPSAIGEAIALRKTVAPWHDALFIVENRVGRPVPPDELARVADGAAVSEFAKVVMDPIAVEILQARGLKDIPNLDRVQLNARHGIARGVRIRNDLDRFREAAIEAVSEAARWLAGE